LILLAVNLHYVAAVAPSSPRAIFPISVDELRSLATRLLEDFEPVSIGDILSAEANASLLPERGFIVTFDDGLREQLELGVSTLRQFGINPVCFVPGMPIVEHRVLHVHKLHWLRESLAEIEFADRLRDSLAGTPYSIEGVDVAVASSMYRYDTEDAARIKYLLNVQLPRDHRESVVASMFREHWDEREFASSLYLDEAEVRELARLGALGAHAYSHVPLKQLSDRELMQELEHTAVVLERMTGLRTRALSYPYGGEDAVDTRVAATAAAAGFRVAFTMERAVNRSLRDPLLLARIDWVDAPGGRRPLFRMEGGEILCQPAMTPHRTRYLDEAASSASATNSSAYRRTR
jgi:peptidoglycan/xylan/chitin deacetylase (PgdA/CDA1 family)